MNPFREDIVRFLVAETPLTEAEAAPLLEIPPDPKLGDFAVPCFALAKLLRKGPPQIAKDLAAAFAPTDLVTGVVAAGPYLNFSVDRARFAADVLADPAAPQEDGAGKTIVLDYAAPNIAKHLAYHHLRSTCIGYSLKRIFDHLGFRTVGINHLGDWGTTHGKLIAAWRRWGEGVDLTEDGVSKLNELYVRFNREGDEEEGREWFRKLEEGDPEATALWERFREISLEEFQQVFDRLGVTFDVVKGESEFVRDADAAIAKVEEKGLATVSDGALVVPFPDTDEPPFFLRKADGATVYATRDLAAGLERYEKYRFDRCLYVVDRGQSLHLKQLFRVLSMMGNDWADRMEHVSFGVILFGGKKTGSRKGNVVLLREVLDEAVARIGKVIEEKNPDLEDPGAVARDVGVGAIVFADLATRRVKDVEFEWEDVLNFEGHTGPYVQYTHARCASILRRAGGAPAGADLSLLALPEEWEVVKLLGGYPDRVRMAARDAEPSAVAQYLLTLSETFSRYYNLGNQDPAMKVLAPDEAVAAARLTLTEGVRAVLASGLALLGIRAPEAM